MWITGYCEDHVHLQLNRPFLVLALLYASLMQLSALHPSIPSFFPAAVTTDDLASNVCLGTGIVNVRVSCL